MQSMLANFPFSFSTISHCELTKNIKKPTAFACYPRETIIKAEFFKKQKRKQFWFKLVLEGKHVAHFATNTEEECAEWITFLNIKPEVEM